MSDYTPNAGDVVDVALSGKVTQVYPRDGYAVVYLTNDIGNTVVLPTDSATSFTRRRPEPQPGDVWLDGDGDTWIVGDDRLLRVLGFSNTRLARNGEQWSDVDAAYDGLTLAVRDGKAVTA